MSSEEEDYLSDVFLQKIEDVRPGLIKKRTQIREVKIEVKKLKRAEEQKANSSKERLNKGLNSALPATNIGFKLLQRMGYKEGGGLGKSSSGIVEPIGIDIKTDRRGLGLIPKRIVRKVNTKTDDGISEEEYKTRMAQKSEEVMIKKSLRKCQTTCEQIDRMHDIEKPLCIWYWPEKLKPEDLEDDVEEEESDPVPDKFEQFQDICKYLRSSYFYCYWCGAKFDSLDDLEANCPGEDENSH